jgi:hypothetical protein
MGSTSMQGLKTGPAKDHAARYGFWWKPWRKKGELSAPMFEGKGCLRRASWRGAIARGSLAGDLAVTPHRQEHQPNQACIHARRCAVDKGMQGRRADIHT